MTKRMRTSIVLMASLAALLALAAAAVFAQNVDPLNIGSKYAWGENIGWLNAQPSGPTGPGLTVTSTDVTGYMWSEHAGWMNFSCKTNSLCGGAAGSWGVGNDGAGHLSGYAWGENSGWLNFSCGTNSACGGPAGTWGVSIDPATGIFSGQAWGENVGWITFNCTSTSSCGSVAYQVQTGWPVDTDGDGVLSYDELMLSFVNLKLNAKEERMTEAFQRLDLNGDGRVSIEELEAVLLKEGLVSSKDELRRLVKDVDTDKKATKITFDD